MLTSLQTSPLYADLLGDVELAARLDATADCGAMIAVEVALAKAQSQLGIIPKDAGPQIGAALDGFTPDPGVMAAGVASAGVPIPALVAELRRALPPHPGQWLHWGATTQDIMDTAAVIQAAACLDILESRLSRLIDALHAASDRHADTVMAGRTRSRMAAPVTLGLRIAQWARPLITLEADLASVRSRALRVQFGGAVGSNSAVAPHGPEISRLMALDLGLQDSPPWHVDRSGLMALAGWLLQVGNALTKFARDLIVSSRSEIAEISAGTGGGSSTMPQKSNPVQAETIAAMGTAAIALHAGLAAAASPVEERDSTAWTLEWIFLPQLFLTTGCALRHGVTLAETIEANRDRIRANLEANSSVMAEAASFALAEHLPRAEAQAVVKQASKLDLPLGDALRQVTSLDIDWAERLDPGQVIEPCRQIATRIFAGRRA